MLDPPSLPSFFPLSSHAFSAGKKKKRQKYTRISFTKIFLFFSYLAWFLLRVEFRPWDLKKEKNLIRIFLPFFFEIPRRERNEVDDDAMECADQISTGEKEGNLFLENAIKLGREKKAWGSQAKNQIAESIQE